MNSPKSDQNSWSAIASSSKVLKAMLFIVGGFVLSYVVYIWSGGKYETDDWSSPPVWYAASIVLATVTSYAIWYFKQGNKQKNKDASTLRK